MKELTIEQKAKAYDEAKVEPKHEPEFHEGDWVTDGHVVYQIQTINKNDCLYGVSDDIGTGYAKFDIIDDLWHLWSIEDAKDGDVLVCKGKHGQEIGIVKNYIGKYGGCSKCFETYCYVDWDGVFRVGEYMGSRNIHPATKEQLDLLFEKMNEAGYKWDANNKTITKNE